MKIQNPKSKIQKFDICHLVLGFTLVELMISITIIGILAAVSTVAFQGAKRSARDADRKADLEDIRSAIEIYKADCGVYPPEPLPWEGALTRTCAGATNTYMSQVPQDPENATRGYRYEYVTNGTYTAYSICARIENRSAGAGACASVVGRNCQAGAPICNYQLNSP